MYKIIIRIMSILFFIVTTMVKAQNFQGKAYYQTKRSVDLDLNIDGDSSHVNDDMQKQIKEMLRKQFEKTYVLTFNKTASIYKEEEKLAKPKPQSGFMIEIGGGNNVLYKNTKTKMFVSREEQFGKVFLINGPIKELEWKMTKETKMIGKYLCIKTTAIMMVDDYDIKTHKVKETKKEKLITAWYTPEIPVNTGPEHYGALPGLIIELHEDKMHYVCNKIVMNPSEKIEIVAPKKGKKITQKEFDIMMEKKMKEMEANFHDGGRKKGNSSHTTIFIGG